ncbi:hypothetical protein EGW36_11805 [Enterococcus faecium]|uniref:Uncharacterized protein n=1 Tax=Enterococcus faecium TaxID=1352 RepID=A0AB74CSE7_ENTFC|nr:hypothetical protein [Enterococcus faecium]EGP5400426.1 hypothetical protein [Enterococcus faecium]EGP5632302.1 hypothetical protein [Enterococcus faecium]PQC79162.1 hypothetical protein CUM69_11025 [Enterococcus faecium]ROX50594.1 hypothetical protein EGW28_01975 [Enterococcus faecium]
MSLPFHSESQGAISKNSSSYFSFERTYCRRCKLLNNIYRRNKNFKQETRQIHVCSLVFYWTTPS